MSLSYSFHLGFPISTNLDNVTGVRISCQYILTDYRKFATETGNMKPIGVLYNEIEMKEYLSEKEPIRLTDNYAPTDILVAPLFRKLYTNN